MAPVRARKRKVAQPVAAAVEPTITRSRAVTTPATSHVPPAATRGRKRHAGQPRASGDPLMASQAVDDRRPVADRDSLPQMAAYTSASWHASDDSRPALHPDMDHQVSAPLLESAAATTARRDWEETVEQRLLQSHQLLQEMHQMMSEQREHGDTRLGAQSSADFMTPLADLPQEAIPFSAPGRTASGQVDGATAPPWPTMQGSSHGEQGLGVGAVIDSLPQQTRERVRVFTKAAVSIHAHVPANVRGKVWAGEYVEMSSLLPGFRSSEPNFTLGVQQQGDNGPSVVCVGPKAKPDIKNFQQWMKAFHIYMSLYLSQPIHYHEGPALLKYIDTISDLSERGGNWLTYDETFRALRSLEGWGWDTTVSELWLRAAQTGSPKVSPAYGGTPFQNKGAIRRSSPNPCFAFNKGQMCDMRLCRYQHKCRRCGAGHPMSKCPTPPPRQANPSRLPAAMSRSNIRQ